MYGLRPPRALAPGFLTLVVLFPNASLAQPAAETLPTIVVTATRSPLEISRSGSAISIIEAAEIEKSGAKGLPEVLRSVPGLDVRERGGTGSVSYATLRGSNSGQTLVLIDGIRVGDPTGTDGALDLGAIAIVDIERIEVLRGPQSALYGSDAMGGVINIITRKGEKGVRRSVLMEAGSYGTLHSRGAISGGDDRLSYAFGVDFLHADGFARYIDRNRVRLGTWPTPPKTDPTDRVGVSGRVSYRLSDNVEVEAGLMGSFNRLSYDNPFAFISANIYDRFNRSKQWSGNAFTRATIDAFDGRLRNTLTLFANSLDRKNADTESCPDFFSNCVSNFRGQRHGAEYQGDLKLGAWGLLTFGARTETERATTSQDYPAGYFGPLFQGVSARQTTNSIFALHQIGLGDAMDVSLGGRIDAVEGGKTFPTWRATWAYRIPDSGTKLRASAGTGAKTPSLFQRFSQYGDPNLNPERSVGYDFGIDQSLLQGRLNLSATVYFNKYQDLIDFRFAGCAPGKVQGCYYNIGRAVTQGVELAADAIIAPESWRARASYTYLDAKNEITKSLLLQRPRNKASFSLIFTGIAKLELEGRATLVGKKFDYGFPSPTRIAPYARFDAFANYKLNDTFSLFARVENIGNAHYEEVANYTVAGRSFYGGVKATW